jgi:hypothetical protein
MPLELDSYDVSILKALLKDGRKSFREISRETGITTPTVKSRFDRLVKCWFHKICRSNSRFQYSRRGSCQTRTTRS